MNIAVFHELHQGGARRAVNEIAKQLKKEHTVDLYLIDEKNDNNEKEYYTSIHFFRFKPKQWRGNNWKIRLYKDTIELFKLYLLHKKIAKQINAKKYDVVFIHPSQYTQAPFILRFLRKKTIYYCQEPLRLVYDPLLKIKQPISIKIFYEKTIRQIRKKNDKNNISFAKLLLANSVFSKNNIFNAYGKNTQVCYLGVDTEFFKPGKNKRDIDILLVNKRPSEKDSLLQELTARLAKKYNIHTLGNTNTWISEKELLALYQRTKIVVCLSRNEPFGLIPLEAGASGCVTIAINEGGFKESISNNLTGFLVEPDMKVIEKTIDKLIAHPKDLIKISSNAREEILKKWTWKHTAKHLEQILKQ